MTAMTSAQNCVADEEESDSLNVIAGSLIYCMIRHTGENSKAFGDLKLRDCLHYPVLESIGKRHCVSWTCT